MNEVKEYIEASQEAMLDELQGLAHFPLTEKERAIARWAYSCGMNVANKAGEIIRGNK